MVFCGSCRKTIAHPQHMDGRLCCPLCGHVLGMDNFSEEPTFAKNASGQSQLSGTYRRSVQSEYSASRERTLSEARYGIESIMYALNISDGDSVSDPAVTLYRLALDRNFTKGRRKEQVQAACLYIVCRKNKKPFLLIDFSEHLRINVYVLGAVFLQLCKLLSLQEDPIVQKPVDPSLFIHRFSERLFGGKKPSVSRTALRILFRMKRDWMQTGRKPSGLCGAALYISSLSHGLACLKSEVIKVVHVCEATLTKRLIEFENTESGGLTVEEFNSRAEELEREEHMLMKSPGSGFSEEPGNSELLCQHRREGTPHFRHGLCRNCYREFIEISGGLDGGSEPPAFQRAEKEREMAKEAESRGSAENESESLNHSTGRCEDKTEGTKDDDDDEDDDAAKESESLSDIDEAEVNDYLHTEEEKELKKVIWEAMNKEYIEEQRAKEAEKKRSEVDFSNCCGDVEGALKLRSSMMEAQNELKRQKRLKRAVELNSLDPPRTPGEAAQRVLQKKGFSSKIRWDAVKALLDEPVEIPEEVKKRRIEEAEFDQYGDEYDNNWEEERELENEQMDDELDFMF